MSARHSTTRDAATSHICESGYLAEVMLVACQKLGLKVALYEPDIAKPVKLEVFGTRAQYLAARAENDRLMTVGRSGIRTSEPKKGERRMPDYVRYLPNERHAHKCRLHCEISQVIDICEARQLEYVIGLYSGEDEAFYIMEVIATDSAYKAAQFDWLQQMILHPPKPLVRQQATGDYF